MLGGEGDGGNVVPPPLPHRLSPTTLAVRAFYTALPHRPGAMTQERAQIDVALCGDPPQHRLPPCGMLCGDQPQLGCELAAVLEGMALANCRDKGSRGHRSHAGAYPFSGRSGSKPRGCSPIGLPGAFQKDAP